jgi:hypothetical protein
MDKLIFVLSQPSEFQIYFLDDRYLDTVNVLKLPEWRNFIGEKELHQDIGITDEQGRVWHARRPLRLNVRVNIAKPLDELRLVNH